MLNKRSTFGVLAIIIVVSVFGFEYYLNFKESKETFQRGKSLKSKTNSFFLPTSTSNQVVHHEGYSLSYSERHEQSEWVAYELKKSQLSKANFKRPYFEIDRAVKTGAAHWYNYKNSGYDRGHLCPAADRKYSKSAFDETFLTSNISPQEHEFNSGIWNSLEQKVRYWAFKFDGVFVVTGGVLNNGLESIGDEKVSVPKQFYKVLMDYNSKTPKMIAFLLPHKNSNESLYTFVVATDSIESLTGLDFFPKLEDSLENKLEANSDFKKWGF